MKSLKHRVFERCQTFLDNRIVTLTNAIKEIQRSSNEETKSSAGDKYETARAMAQLEMDKYWSQLAEANKMKQELARISTEDNTSVIKPGSLVFTSRGNFYIAINAGQQQEDGQTFFTVSTASPIAQKLIGLKGGDTFTLNAQEFIILQIL